MAVPDAAETTETTEVPAPPKVVDPVLKAVANNPFLGTTLVFLLAGCIKLMAVSNWNVTTALAILGRTDTTSLLTDRERAIVQLPKDAVVAHEICNFAPSSSWRWTLIIQHPAQLATGTQRTSPYAYCPNPPPLPSD